VSRDRWPEDLPGPFPWPAAGSARCPGCGRVSAARLDGWLWCGRCARLFSPGNDPGSPERARRDLERDLERAGQDLARAGRDLAEAAWLWQERLAGQREWLPSVRDVPPGCCTGCRGPGPLTRDGLCGYCDELAALRGARRPRRSTCDLVSLALLACAAVTFVIALAVTL
jgi:hypothetical protein